MQEISPHMQAFIDAELTGFAAYLKEQARERILRMGLVMDEDLLHSLSVSVASSEIAFSFSDHGRMQDGGYGKDYHKGKYLGPSEREHLLKGRKPIKWYSPLAYGSVYGRLVPNLMNRYIAEVPGMVKNAAELGNDGA